LRVRRKALKINNTKKEAKMNSLKWMSLVLATVVSLNTARATTVEIADSNVITGGDVWTSLNDNNGWTIDWELSESGLIELTIDGDTTDLFDSRTIYGFCAQYSEDFSKYRTGGLIFGHAVTETYEITDVDKATEEKDAPATYLDSNKASALSELWQAYYNESWQTSSTYTNDVNAAAFQICVWEIIADYNGTAGSLNLDNGNFQIASKSVEGVANPWLNSLTTLINDGNAGADLRILKNDGCQNFLVEVTSVTPVPEPATLIMLLATLPCVLSKRMKKIA
jgi:hypothetical protein